MSLDKAIKHKKEHRTPYSGAKAIDPGCRNHGDCPWCTSNRTIKTKKQSQEAKSKLREGGLRNKEVLSDEMEYFENMLNATKTEKCCPRCKTTLYCSDLPDYDYVCPECDENFYNIEVK